MGDISFHFDCTYEWETIKSILQSGKITTSFLMNANHEQIAYALQHCEFVVVRIFDPFNEYRGGDNPDFEKDVIANHGANEFASFLDQNYARFRYAPRIRWVVGWNELYSKRGIAERNQNRKIIDIANAMIDSGFGVGLVRGS